MAYEIAPPTEDIQFIPEANSGTAFNWRGAWVDGRTYYLNEAVSFTIEGRTSSYRANKTTTAIPGYSPNDWEIISGVSAVGSGLAGSDELELPFSFGDSSPKLIYNASNELIKSASIIISTPFNGSATLTLGDGGNNSRLIDSTQIYPEEVGTYKTYPGYKYTSLTDIYLYIDLGFGNTTGNGYVILEI